MTRQEYEEHFKLVKKSHESELRDLNKILDYIVILLAGMIAGFFTDYIIFATLETIKIITHDVLLRSLPFGMAVGALFALVLLKP